jgi:hypothetical protein
LIFLWFVSFDQAKEMNIHNQAKEMNIKKTKKTKKESDSELFFAPPLHLILEATACTEYPNTRKTSTSIYETDSVYNVRKYKRETHLARHAPNKPHSPPSHASKNVAYCTPLFFFTTQPKKTTPGELPSFPPNLFVCLSGVFFLSPTLKNRPYRCVKNSVSMAKS